MLVVTSWLSGARPEEEVFYTLPIWVTLSSLKRKFWNDEVVAHMASTLGTPWQLSFSFINELEAVMNNVIVVDANFVLPMNRSIIIEDEMGQNKVKGVQLTYPHIPP